MNLPQGKYQYVQIDLSQVRHVNAFSPVFWKDRERFEVTRACDDISLLAGVCLSEMDIDDKEIITVRDWGWRLNFWPKRQVRKLGPTRYFFMCVCEIS